MIDRRGEEPGRRKEDERWLKVQEQVMNLVTTSRTTQNTLASMEVEFERLSDHVDELDDHLRGVAGKESLDVRVTLTEKEVVAHGVMLRRISEQFDTLHRLLESSLQEIRSDLSVLKIRHEVTKGFETTRTERIKVWLTFWGPIILATIALIVPLATLAVTNWDRLRAMTHYDVKSNVDRWIKEIENRKKDPATKKLLQDRYGVNE